MRKLANYSTHKFSEISLKYNKINVRIILMKLIIITHEIFKSKRLSKRSILNAFRSFSATLAVRLLQLYCDLLGNVEIFNTES
jgi:hypothetical protein